MRWMITNAVGVAIDGWESDTGAIVDEYLSFGGATLSVDVSTYP